MKPYIRMENNRAELYIYGDIEDYKWLESDVTSYQIAKELSGITTEEIDVYINSYGGSVAAGLAIYNSLKQHKAKVKTYCDGFACSIASVIFMAGDERMMSGSSLLMVHNPWTNVSGNAEELRKTADDLDKMTQASIHAYMDRATISEEEIKKLLNEETWILPSEALEYGFATSIIGLDAREEYSQSARRKIMQCLTGKEIKRKETVPKKPKEAENPLLNLFAKMKEL